MPKPSTKRWNKFNDRQEAEFGRKKRGPYLTDSEWAKVKKYIDDIRREK